MSDWITDRLPTIDDVPPSCDVVFDSQGRVVFSGLIAEGEAWKPIPKCEPYVKPKRWEAKWNGTCWSLYYDGGWRESLIHLDFNNDEVREAAERIAAIYEEVMP